MGRESETYLLLGSPELVPRFPGLCSRSVFALGSGTTNLTDYLLPLFFRCIIIVDIAITVTITIIDVFVMSVSDFLDRCRVEIVVGMRSWRKGISAVLSITQHT